MTLDAYIQDRRKADANFTVGGFADAVGLSHSQVNRLRLGTSKPSLRAIKAIERVTRGKVTADDWLVEVAE